MKKARRLRRYTLLLIALGGAALMFGAVDPRWAAGAIVSGAGCVGVALILLIATDAG